jgi:hypothetical protein
VGPQLAGQTAIYFSSSAPYFDPGTAPDASFPVVAYERSVLEVYDLIYYQISAIPDAGAYIPASDDSPAEKKFFMDVWSEATACTQIMIQLDSLALANETNFPIGRHSRYVAYTTTSNEWERLAFEYLDQPDSTVPDSDIDAMVLFFNPGVVTTDTYYFRNFDSANIGCSNGCEEASIPQSCPAPIRGESGACDDGVDNDLDGLIDCEDPECSLSDPVCVETMTMSFRSATNALRSEERNTGGSGSHSSIQEGSFTLCVAVMTTFLWWIRFV